LSESAIVSGAKIVSDEFKQGDRVQWESSQGTIEGTVKKKLTEPTDIKGHHVAASKDAPQYLVESDKTGKEAAHKPESLTSRED
jgi:small-conductance mechanosensitive channel